MRDPYAIYARHVLGLKALEPLDAEPGAADRGMLIHEALDRFVVAHPAGLPDAALDRLLAIGRDCFGAALARPAIWVFWWPRFERIAAWFVAREADRRGALSACLSEVEGVLAIAAPGGPFTLTARADRIERRRDGALVLVDYKTGTPPRPKDIELGFAPQLPLEAAIALAGGFAGLAPAAIAGLEHWRLGGGAVAGEILPLPEDPTTLAEAARDGLGRLVAAFDDPATAYEARPHPRFPMRYSDYIQLARVAEWAVLEGEE